MRWLSQASPRALIRLGALPLVLSSAALLFAAQDGPAPERVTPAAAREAISRTYETWGRARVAYDRETLEKVLADDFYVSLYGQRISRQKFLDDIASQRTPARLTRFDAAVLTVRPSEEGWTAVITEKLELEFPGADGTPQRLYSLWITRDGWRQQEGEWLVTSSEAIGHEDWVAGAPPPFPDW